MMLGSPLFGATLSKWIGVGNVFVLAGFLSILASVLIILYVRGKHVLYQSHSDNQMDVS